MVAAKLEKEARLNNTVEPFAREFLFPPYTWKYLGAKSSYNISSLKSYKDLKNYPLFIMNSTLHKLRSFDIP